LHNRSGISAKTKAQVLRVAEQLGYKPNMAACSLNPIVACALQPCCGSVAFAGAGAAALGGTDAGTELQSGASMLGDSEVIGLVEDGRSLVKTALVLKKLLPRPKSSSSP
jgi:hypothetical protein